MEQIKVVANPKAATPGGVRSTLTQTGVALVNLTGVSQSCYIDFDEEFELMPVVVLTCYTYDADVNVHATLTEITAASCVFTIYNLNDSSGSGAVLVQWMAAMATDTPQAR